MTTRERKEMIKRRWIKIWVVFGLAVLLVTCSSTVVMWSTGSPLTFLFGFLIGLLCAISSM
jgi:hypothetical protein